MHLNRQIILLFFLSSIVKPSSIVNIVNRQSSRYRQPIVNRQSSRSEWCRRSRSRGPGPGPGVQVQGQQQDRNQQQDQQQDQTSPADPFQEPGPGAGPKGIYIWNATAPQKINKKNLRVKVATGRGRRIFEPTNNPNP